MWQQTLGTMADTVAVWEVVSKTWQALESIFLASEDIRPQLPDDTKRFEYSRDTVGAHLGRALQLIPILTTTTLTTTASLWA